MQRILYISLLLLVLTMGCGRRDMTADRLDTIDSLCGTDPRRAVAMLDSIDRGSLPEKDRHRLDLLTVNSRDKAYIRHPSDSLILDAIDYYSGHRKEGLYPEALYYGGRVYSDLGDLPTALGYFQKALDLIPDSESHSHLNGVILSQTGLTLLSLRLDSDAVVYLEKALAVYNVMKDNYAVAFTHELLGHAYLNKGDSQTALHHISNAVRMSTGLPDVDSVNIDISLAHILETTGNMDSALNVIRNLPEKADSITLSYCLATAAQIYRDANIPDTAYMYARRLTLLRDPANRRTGYSVIFSDGLKDYVPKDTLIALVPEYKKTIEEYLDTHEGEKAISQHTRYNYDLHVREREKTRRQLYLSLIGLAVTVILLLAFLT